MLKLQTIIEEAIDEGADTIEMEYVTGGLEVTYLFGDIGIGGVINNRKEVSKIITEIIEQANLQHKDRGILDWTYKSYRIQVEAYDSFGETAFRLKLRPSKRQPT